MSFAAHSSSSMPPPASATSSTLAPGAPAPFVMVPPPMPPFAGAPVPPPPVPLHLLATMHLSSSSSTVVPAGAPPHVATTIPPTAGVAVERRLDGDATMASTSTSSSAAAAAPATPAALPELDLAFCCDCTGSMGAYIKSAQDNIRLIASQIYEKKGGSCSLRFALVKYRDHPPQDSTYVTEVYPFTKSLEVMKANIDTMAAAGGGDGPEAVTAALHEVLELNWRPNATKVCVFIADAPPHGLGEAGDGFPQGSPDGKDPIVVTRGLAQKGITVYAIGVEPVLSTSYKFARDFMMMVASMTEGKFLPLGKAAILAEVIVSTALEGLELQSMWGQLEAQVAAEAEARNEQLSTEQLIARVEKAVAEKATTAVVQQVEVTNPYLDARYDYHNREAMMQATSLHAARAAFKTDANAHVSAASAGYAWGAQAMSCAAPAPMSHEQVARSQAYGSKKHGVFK